MGKYKNGTGVLLSGQSALLNGHLNAVSQLCMRAVRVHILMLASQSSLFTLKHQVDSIYLRPLWRLGATPPLSPPLKARAPVKTRGGGH